MKTYELFLVFCSDKYATKIAEEIIAGKPVHQTQLPTTNNPGSNTGDCTGAKVVVIDGDGQAVSVVRSVSYNTYRLSYLGFKTLDDGLFSMSKIGAYFQNIETLG